MAEKRSVVIGDSRASNQLPEWAQAGVVTIQEMQESGTWTEAGKRLAVQRQGGYAGIDAVQFLLYFFGARLSIGLKDFSDRCRRYAKKLAAVGGRRRLPTQSSMSRVLGAVSMEMAQEFGVWLLQDAPDVGNVLRHPSVLTRDAVGGEWHVFDWDPTVTTLRQRALPVFDGMPDGLRRAVGLAKPGYPGRKRGEVQFSRATLQHAGSGLWLGIRTAPGNGALREAFQWAVAQTVAVCDRNGIAKDRAIMRTDGVGGNVPFVTASCEAGIHYITRLAHYQLLVDPKIVEHLNQAPWTVVPSSGSGPVRQAADLGFVLLEPAPTSLRDDGGTYPPVRTRVVVSRFPCEKEQTGAGLTIGNWHYELFGTDLEAAAWPEVEVVASYFGRTGQENRFAQEDRELGLDRIFSYSLPGQELAMLVGLFVWNWRICRGMEMAQPPEELPEQQAAVRTPLDDGPQLPSPASPDFDPTSTGVRPENGSATEQQQNQADRTDQNAQESEVKPQTLFEALDALDWVALLSDRPGWRWDVCSCGLRCPANATIPFTSIEVYRGRATRARFRAAPGACNACPLRKDCVRTSAPQYCKDIRLFMPKSAAELLRSLWSQLPKRTVGASSRAFRRSRRWGPRDNPSPSVTWRTKPLSWSPPSADATAPLFKVAGPMLLPAELRKTVVRESRQVQVHVRVEMPREPHKASPVLAPNAARRQHRRLTWDERLLWNVLPDGATVEVRLNGPQRICCLLRQRSPRTSGTEVPDVGAN